MKARDKAIWLPTGNEYEAIEIDAIYYCQSRNQYTVFYVHDGSIKLKQLVSSKGIGEWEKQLADHDFYRIHSHTLVNLKYVKKFVNNKEGLVVLTNEVNLVVSKSKKQKFMEFTGIKELNSN